MIYAGFWMRLAALVIDLVITNIASFVAGFVVGLTLSLNGVTDSDMLEVAGGIAGGVLSWLYNTLLESSAQQATLGKMALGIKVTNLEGGRIGFGRANGRYFSKILSAFVLFIGFLLAAFTEKKQGLHDLIAGTLVVKKSATA